MKTRVVRCLVGIVVGFGGAAVAEPISTSFTYQGELLDAGGLANGSYDLQFRLFDGAGGLTQLGPALCSDNVAVVNGKFTVSLDFGAVLDGNKRFLEIAVRNDAGAGCAVSAGFLTLGPRQELAAAPYSSFAAAAQSATNATSAGDAQNFGGQPASFYLNRANQTGILPGAGLSGLYSAALTFSNPTNSFSGNGANLNNLNANAILAGTLSPARGGTGSSITSATVGQVLKWNGTTFFPQNDQDTTYSAGTGLTLGGTVFSIGPGQVNSTMVLDNTLTAADISAGAVASSELAIDGASLSKVSGGALSASGTNLSAAGTLTTTGNITSNGSISADSFSVPSAARSIIISAASFTGDAKIVHDNGTNLEFLSSGSTVQGTTGYAPVHLPTGAVITKVTAYIVDSSVLSNVNLLLLRRTPDNSSAGGTMCSIGSTGSDPAIRAFADTTISAATIDNNFFMYYLKVDFPAGASLYLDNPNLTGVKIEYTTTSPAPW